MDVIVSHFINYPLVSQKRADFELFKAALDIFNLSLREGPSGPEQKVSPSD